MRQTADMVGPGMITSRSMAYLADVVGRQTDLPLELVGGSAGLSLDEVGVDDVAVLVLDGARPEEDGRSLASYLLSGGFFVGNLRGDDGGGGALHGRRQGGDRQLGAPRHRSGYFVQGRLAGISTDPALTWDPPLGTPEGSGVSAAVELVVNALVFARLQLTPRTRVPAPRGRMAVRSRGHARVAACLALSLFLHLMLVEVAGRVRRPPPSLRVLHLDPDSPPAARGDGRRRFHPAGLSGFPGPRRAHAAGRRIPAGSGWPCKPGAIF